jgi:hypothetical protein
MNVKRSCKSALLLTVTCVVCLPCFSQTSFPTRVVLDRETFPSANYAELQRVADVVAQNVDQLIPGRMSEFVYGDILCYLVKENDVEAVHQSSAPITISANYKLSFEPKAVIAGHTRIAVNGLGSVEHFLEGQFVYQLAHELAHVKMGVRLDNYLVETLAVTVSHEVLLRMGMVDFLQIEFNTEMLQLPESVQAAYKTTDIETLIKYWQSVIPREGLRVDDRPFQTLGATLVRMRAVQWESLLGVALMNSNCPLNNPPSNYAACPPDLQRMKVIAPILESLGYDLTHKGSADKQRPGSLMRNLEVDFDIQFH